MKQIYILAKNKETYFIKSLINVLGSEMVTVLNPWAQHIEDILLHLNLDSLIFVRSTGVYQDDLDLHFLKKLPPSVRLINPLEELIIFRKKSTQYESFKKWGLPHLPWIHLQEVKKFQIENFLMENPSEKYLIKPDRGQGGWGIRVFSKSELLAWFDSSLDKDFVLQPFVETLSEYRIFFISEDSFWLLKRTRADGGLCANFHQGGEAFLMPPLTWARELIKKLKMCYRLDYGAVDIFYLNNDIHILEINIAPGIEQLEKIAKISISQQLVLSICQKNLSKL